MFEPTSIFDESNDESVLTRIQDDDGSQIITIFHAPHDVLGEDGPIITQIADDSVFVIFSDEYIQEKIGNAIELNPDQSLEESVLSGIAVVIGVAGFEERFRNDVHHGADRERWMASITPQKAVDIIVALAKPHFEVLVIEPLNRGDG